MSKNLPRPGTFDEYFAFHPDISHVEYKGQLYQRCDSAKPCIQCEQDTLSGSHSLSVHVCSQTCADRVYSELMAYADKCYENTGSEFYEMF